MRKMKRWMALLLTGTALLTLAACKKKGDDKPTLATSAAAETTAANATSAPEIASWTIEVRGVPNVTQLKSLEAQYLPKLEVDMTSTNAEGFTVTNRYGGVTLRSILGYFGVPDAATVEVVSIDGSKAVYTQNIAMAEDTLLAWEIDGKPIDTSPPLRMCPRTGSPDQYVKLVSAINIVPLSAAQTTTDPGSYVDLYSSTYPPFPTYTYPVSQYIGTNPKTTTTTTTTSTTTTAPTTTTASTTTATTTTTRATYGSYSYPGPANPSGVFNTTTTTTTATTTGTTGSTIPTRPPDLPPNFPWS